tara:strand:- start:1180 stop:1374 length:195 start_codon:yes stop_codon:yes gene_type:complete
MILETGKSFHSRNAPPLEDEQKLELADLKWLARAAAVMEIWKTAASPAGRKLTSALSLDLNQLT